jgi:hypothetical protein
MNDSINNQWFRYLETPRSKSNPVKLDQILAERLQAFLKARKVKPYRIKTNRTKDT